MNTVEQSSAGYWDKTAGAFDAIYSGEKKTPLGVFLNRWLRRDIYERVEETVRIANAMGQCRQVLDVGTGTGRLCVPLAQAGHQVAGVDFSPEMLSLAGNVVKAAGVSELCSFFLGDMVNGVPADLKSAHPRMDLAAALGVVDYISDTLPFFRNILTFSPRKIIVSFPREGTLRAYIRRLRYRIQRLDCPLYFYSPEQIRELGKELGAKYTSSRIMGELYFTVFEF